MSLDELAPLRLRILNAGRGIGPAYAARLLADLGATVSWYQWSDPRPGDWPDSDHLFRKWFERGVEVIEEHQSQESLLHTLDKLAPEFDLILTDFVASECPFGGTYERLRNANPALVVANADHFGREGPYAYWTGDEVTDYAMGGYWALAGDPGHPPLRVPGFQGQFHVGMQLALAAVSAARYARLTGRGQEVECTGIEAMLGAHWSTTVAWTHEGRILKRAGSDLFKAADGWVFFYRMGLNPNIFILIDRPELMDDPRWATITDWLANAAELWSLVEEWCRDKRVDEIVRTAQELRIPTTPMATAPDLVDDPVLGERGFFVDVDGAQLPGMPYLWSRPWESAVPGSRLRDALGKSDQPKWGSVVGVTGSTVTSGDGPLTGIRVLELTNNWAGPIAARHLADLGADVIKFELAAKSATRASHYPGKEPGREHWNRSGYFNEMNRNKRDVALDLSTARGRELFLEAVTRADIIIENNSARVMPNLGLGYDQLAEINPRIIMASISGFGATGARRDWLAFGSNIEAACGLAAITGYEGGLPQRTGSFVADPIAGAHAVIAVIAALDRRDREGIGDHIDISLTESALPFFLESFTHYHQHDEPRPRMGNIDPWDAPIGAYRSFGSDSWIAIAVRTDEQWNSLAKVAGIDESLGRNSAARCANRQVIDHDLEAWTQNHDQYEAVRLLQAVGVAAAPILHNWQLHSDPHLFARSAFVSIEHPSTGVVPYPGFPWRFSHTPGSVRWAAPRFAEGNGYFFGGLLGLSADQIEELYASGVTAHEPVGLTPIVI